MADRAGWRERAIDHPWWNLGVTLVVIALASWAFWSVEAGTVEKLFARFDAHLKDAGYLAMGGQIVDASIVAAPRQRMTDEEREIVKGGGIPPDWQAKPRKLAQKDRDARWTLKRGRKKKR